MRKRRKKKGPVRSKKVVFDGITFASGLERYMYQVLKKAGIKAKYEGETYTLIDSFNFMTTSYERQSNGKGEFKDRGNKKILPIKYTPDFVLHNGICLETKGFWRPEDRRKIRQVINDNPDIDLRMIFQDPYKKISKKSKTTYAKWCQRYGIKWCAYHAIPVDWLT